MTIKRIIYPILCALLGLAACKKDATNIKPADTTDTSVVSNIATGINNSLMLKLVNDTRATGCNCGTTAMPPVAPLKWNDVLASAALIHSKDMNATGQLIHNSSDGTTFSDRITTAGYKWSAVAENIAWGQTTEQQVFNDWLQSEGHCKNIMTAAYKDFGAARDGVYWTQDFGSPQ